MLIKRIKLHNIRSYTEQEISFPKGSVLLSGNIGSGKTTVLLAIEFALFGLQRGIVDGASLLRNGKNEGFVELEIEIKGKKIKLTRTLKRKKDSVVQDKAILNIDGKDKELSADELKAFVLNILNYPKELLKKQNLIFRYSVYTPQEKMKEIISDAEDRIEIIRRIFNVDKYKRIEDSCNIFISKLKDSIRVNQAKVADLQAKKEIFLNKKAELQNIEKELMEIIPKHEKIKRELANIKKERENLKEKFEHFSRLKQEQAKKTSEFDLRVKQFNEGNHLLGKLQREVMNLKRRLEETSLEYDPKQKEILEKEILEKEREERRLEREIYALENDKKRINAELKNISSSELCPFCKRQITEEHKNKIKEEADEKIKIIDEKIRENKKNFEEIHNKIIEDNKKLEISLEKEKMFEANKVEKKNLQEKEKELEEYDKKMTDIAKQISQLQKELQDIYEEIEKSANLEKEIYDADKKLDDIQEQEKEIIKVRTYFEKGKADIIKETAEIEKEIEEKERVKKLIDKEISLREWLSKQFITVVQYIEKQVMAKLNIEFNLLFKKWFSMLVEDVLEARVDIDFTPVVNQAGYDLDYNYLSGGERTALALAYRLALNQIINSMLSRIATKSILILDEPTEGFSSEQLEKMRQVLDEINVEQLILVSHETKIESFVDNVINFEKEGNVTSVA